MESRAAALAVARPHVKAAVSGLALAGVGIAAALVTHVAAFGLVVGLGSVLMGVSLLRLGPLYRHLRDYGDDDAARAVLSARTAGIGGVMVGIGGMAMAPGMGDYVGGLVELLGGAGNLLLNLGLWIGLLGLVAMVVYGIRAGWHRTVPTGEE